MAFADVLESDYENARDDFGGAFSGTLVIGSTSLSVHVSDVDTGDVLAPEGAGIDVVKSVRAVCARADFAALPSDKDSGTLDGVEVRVIGQRLDAACVTLELEYVE